MATRMYHPSLRPSVVTVDDGQVPAMTSYGWVTLVGAQEPPAVDADRAAYGALVNATADGATNVSAILQAALDAARDAGGGVVTVPGKSLPYALGAPLYLANGVTLSASGASFKALAGCGDMLRAEGQRRAVMAPHALTATPSASGGTLAAAAWTYYVTAVTASGESMSAQATATTTGTTGSVALAWTLPAVPTGAPAITGIKVYRGPASPVLLATLAATATGYTDTGAAGTGATLPTGNGTITRTARPAVIGGTWDVNRATNSSQGGPWQSSRYVGHGFNFQKVDGLTIRGVKIVNADKWAIAVADYTDLTTDDIEFATNSDGVHVLGPGYGWTGRNIRGTVGDDLIGISSVEWPGYTASEGDITGVDLAGIRAASPSPSVFRMLGGTGTVISAVRLADITGGISATSAFAAAGYINNDQANPGRTGTTARDITIQRIALDSGPIPMLIFGATSLTNLLVEDCRRLDASTSQAMILVSGAGTDLDGTFRDLHPRSSTALYVAAGAHRRISVEGLNVAEANRVGVWVASASTVRQLIVDDLHMTPGISGVVGVQTDGTATVTDLRIRRGYMDAGTGLVAMLRVAGTSVVADAEVSGKVLGTGAGVYHVHVNGGTLSRVRVHDASMVGGGGSQTPIYLETGTLAHAKLDGVHGEATQALVKTRLPLVVAMSGVSINGGALVGHFGTGTGVVDVDATDSRIVSGAGITNGSTLTVRSRGLGFRCDLASLQKTANDMATNTNAALSCGAGPVVCDGTTWKHLHTGLTY